MTDGTTYIMKNKEDGHPKCPVCDYVIYDCNSRNCPECGTDYAIQLISGHESKAEPRFNPIFLSFYIISIPFGSSLFMLLNMANYYLDGHRFSIDPTSLKIMLSGSASSILLCILLAVFSKKTIACTYLVLFIFTCYVVIYFVCVLKFMVY